MKLIMSVQNAQIPAHLHLVKENPHLSLDNAGAIVPTTTIEWPTNGKPRLGGVSSFGFSGTIAHAMVTQFGRDECRQCDPAAMRSRRYFGPSIPVHPLLQAQLAKN